LKEESLIAETLAQFLQVFNQSQVLSDNSFDEDGIEGFELLLEILGCWDERGEGVTRQHLTCKNYFGG
jgi:hypothetical protein